MTTRSRISQQIQITGSHHQTSSEPTTVKVKSNIFIIHYKNKHPDKEIDEELFTYPGPDPMSKECTVVMMADAVEAASRALEIKNEENIAKLVNNYHRRSTSKKEDLPMPILTFKDISTVKRVYTEMLSKRISRPYCVPEITNHKHSPQDLQIMSQKPITIKDLAETVEYLRVYRLPGAERQSRNQRTRPGKPCRNWRNKVGYKPNPIAVALKTHKSHSIGVIVPQIVSTFFATVVKTIEEVADGSRLQRFSHILERKFPKRNEKRGQYSLANPGRWNYPMP